MNFAKKRESIQEIDQDKKQVLRSYFFSFYKFPPQGFYRDTRYVNIMTIRILFNLIKVIEISCMKMGRHINHLDLFRQRPQGSAGGDLGSHSAVSCLQALVVMEYLPVSHKAGVWLEGDKVTGRDVRLHWVLTVNHKEIRLFISFCYTCVCTRFP